MCHHEKIGFAEGLDMWWGTRRAWWNETVAALPQGFCRLCTVANPVVALRRIAPPALEARVLEVRAWEARRARIDLRGAAVTPQRVDFRRLAELPIVEPIVPRGGWSDGLSQDELRVLRVISCR